MATGITCSEMVKFVSRQQGDKFTGDGGILQLDGIDAW
jgi:hypothetical protein